MRFFEVLRCSRISKSSLNVAEFMKNFPAEVAPKAKELALINQGLSGALTNKHDAKPPVDFEYYKTRIPDKAFVDKLEKFYTSTTVPYPSDPKNKKATLEEEKKQVTKSGEDLVEEMDLVIFENELKMKSINSLPPMEHMSKEMLCYYFPEATRNDEKSALSEGRHKGIRWFPGYSYGFDRYPKWQLGNRFNNEWEFFPPKEISQRWENLNLQFKKEEQFLMEDPK
ncbi:ATP synthase subunit d, mitochondrial-like [Saccostrea echinata]|uniref:ATP synthase subunit d, mitochondrial-like n=1 Tax=Saccostrea echinata TaxID=191078 RepID=UPI002A83FD4C|nr:ATP synthase subunit d, mitochondrial-like [Saccostrea echinata]